MYLFTRKKAVYYTRKTALSVVEPTKPVGPIYEEVSPKEEIELNTNQAYGPLGLWIKLCATNFCTNYHHAYIMFSSQYYVFHLL